MTLGASWTFARQHSHGLAYGMSTGNSSSQHAGSPEPEDIELRRIQVFDALAASGNINHWWHWIVSLEDAVESSKDYLKPLTVAPLYVAWLLMISEYLCYRIRFYQYVVGDFQNQEAFDVPYKRLIASLPAHIPPEIADDIRLAIRIRHTIIHKGFPNPHDVPVERDPDFNRDEVMGVKALIIKPSNFSHLKQRLHAAITWIGTNTPDFEAGF